MAKKRIDSRVEELEKTLNVGKEERGIRVAIMQSQGYPEPTEEQLQEAWEKYLAKHPDYREGDLVTLNLLHDPNDTDDQPDYERYPARPFRSVTPSREVAK